MIYIENLSKSFESKVIFKKINIKIENGEFIAFSGPSGCGKTTLLNMIGGVEPIDDGSIIVDGIDVHKKKNQLLYFREKVGFLFQNFALIDNKTVKDNLEIDRKSTRLNSSHVAISYAVFCSKKKRRV